MFPATRREARERVLSLLYEAESKRLGPGQVLEELPVAPDPFVTDLMQGIGDEGGRIDTLISEHSIGWTLERMPAVDRALLRMATYELLARDDVPTGVVISEAVELAKQYSTEESGRFVNGVLATIATIVRQPSDDQLSHHQPGPHRPGPDQPSDDKPSGDQPAR